MSDTVTLIGGGGSEFIFDLPLRTPFDEQVAKGALQPATREDRERIAATQTLPSEQTEEPAFEAAAERPPTVDEILQRVGDDRDRAQAALEAEQGREQPRSTLIKALEKITHPEDEAG